MDSDESDRTGQPTVVRPPFIFSYIGAERSEIFDDCNVT
jgi:hypothetical protein